MGESTPFSPSGGSATAVPVLQFVELGNREGCPVPKRHESLMKLRVPGPIHPGALWLGYRLSPSRRVSTAGQAKTSGK